MKKLLALALGTVLLTTGVAAALPEDRNKTNDCAVKDKDTPISDYKNDC